MEILRGFEPEPSKNPSETKRKKNSAETESKLNYSENFGGNLKQSNKHTL
jgi:hypothetical protein